ncbi:MULTISPECIES: hypothetical protein [Actinomadura]|uniref:Uncharacterized protein n=1 Tax=Actinomadura yumaensis TaxID=111807 RepID=A0ABW2CZ44_9ACTN|nr:hypothetical protein [Actinomadura sp. J1-007]
MLSIGPSSNVNATHLRARQSTGGGTGFGGGATGFAATGVTISAAAAPARSLETEDPNALNQAQAAATSIPAAHRRAITAPPASPMNAPR